MSMLQALRRLTAGIFPLLGLTPAVAVESMTLAGSTSPGTKVIVSSEPVMEVVVAGAVNHPLVAAVAMLAAVAFVVFLFRQRQTHKDTPDQPEPPAVASAWPKAFKPQTSAGHFPQRNSSAAAEGGKAMPQANQVAETRASRAPVTLAATAERTDASAFDWPAVANDETHKDGNGATAPGVAKPALARQAATASTSSENNPTIALNSLQLRLRDRYIGVRFPGVAKSSQDLEASGQVIKAARLYFEDDQPRRAIELLELAIEQHPEDEALWLALIEILFLVRMRNEFCKVAARYKVQHPVSPQWAEVTRLGAVIAGDNLMFRAAAGGPRGHEHYGPWPDLPNWIQAPWDLTAEVSAAEFHSRMNQRLTARRSTGAPMAELAKAA